MSNNPSEASAKSDRDSAYEGNDLMSAVSPLFPVPFPAFKRELQSICDRVSGQRSNLLETRSYMLKPQSQPNVRRRYVEP